MGYKTILAHCDADPNVAHRLAIAVELAKRHGAYLVGVHIQEPFNAPAMFERDRGDRQSLRRFRGDGEGKPCIGQGRLRQGREGRRAFDSVAVRRRLYRRAFDRARPLRRSHGAGPGRSSEPSFTPLDLPETMALSTGRPVLVVPHVGASAEPAKTVMLCWNASRESARAASDALPLLRAAAKVIVLCVDPSSSTYGHGAEPGADAAAWLSRHGVKVTVQRDVAADSDVGNVILSRAADLDVGLIVMGLYGHSRLRETVLGGASRTLLASMTVPLFVSH